MLETIQMLTKRKIYVVMNMGSDVERIVIKGEKRREKRYQSTQMVKKHAC